MSHRTDGLYYNHFTLFCVIVLTDCIIIISTGYGHIAPATTGGRIACMLYSIIGIPLCLIALMDCIIIILLFSPGYGHIAPATTGGRIACMLYSIIGIPLCLIVLTDCIIITK